jgi:hypothetical protein
MSDHVRRKELKEQYKQSRPEAGVYRLVNRENGRYLLGSSPNLASMRNKLEFAQATNTPSAVDVRLRKEIDRYGIAAFSFEVLEVLEAGPEITRAQLLADLAALEELWREKLDPSLRY